MSRTILTDPDVIIMPGPGRTLYDPVPMPPGPEPMRVPTEWVQDEEEKQDDALVCHLCDSAGSRPNPRPESFTEIAEMMYGRVTNTSLCGYQGAWALPYDAPNTKPTQGYCPECKRPRCETCRDLYIEMKMEHGGGDDE